MTREFEHYPGCRHRDPDNCSACALTDIRQDAPNYSAWPLAYMENRRTIPAKWRSAFICELTSDNKLYAANVQRTLERLGVRFSDGLPLHLRSSQAPSFISAGPLSDEEAREEGI